MFKFAFDSVIRASAQKTVIEIPSDDSDDPDTDMDSETDGESDTTDTDKKALDSPGASSTESRLISPPTTATTGSPSHTASQHSHPPSVTHSVYEDSASDTEDLTQILKAVRKARAQEASEEQLAPAPTPVLPLSGLSAKIRAAFGDQIKNTSSFFIVDQPSQSIDPQPEVSPEDKTRNDVDAVSKRKAPYDPFAEDILNIESTGYVGPKKKRRDKKRNRPRTNSETPHVDTRQQVSGHVSTFMASQDPTGQRHGPSCFAQTPAVDERSNRPLSLGLKLSMRPRSASEDPAAMKNGRCKGNLNELVTPQSTNLSSLDRHQPSRTAHEPTSSQRVVINLEEDEEDDPVRFPGTSPIAAVPTTQPVEAANRHSVKNINAARKRSGSGVLSSHNCCRKSPATQNRLRNVSAGISQAPSDDLQGRIGGRPERRPAYAQQEASHWDQTLKNARSRQLDLGRIAKRTTPHKVPTRQLCLSAKPADESRLLRAKGILTRRAAPVHPAGESSQKVEDRSGGFRSEHAVRSEVEPLFRPNKNAFHQPRVGDDESDDSTRVQSSYNPKRNTNYQPILDVDEAEDGADPPQSSGGTSGYLPNRDFRLPLRPSSQTHRSSVHQPVRNMNGSIAGYQRPYANASKASRPQLEDWDQTTRDMLAFTRQYEQKPRTTVVDALPPGFSMSVPAEIRQQNKILGRERAKIQHDSSDAERKRRDRISRRKAEILREVRKKFGHMPEQAQNREFETRFNAYVEKHHPGLSQSTNNAAIRGAAFNENFLENGHRDSYTNSDLDDALNERMIPAPDALRRFEPHTPMSIFTVFVSEPYNAGEDPNFKIAQSFDLLAKANEDARSRVYKQRSTDLEFREDASGYAIGRWKLPTGKWKSIKTQQEEVLVGDLPPDASRDKFVDEQLIDKYARDAYDVFFLRLAPRGFWGEEARNEEEENHKRERKRNGELNKRSANSAEERQETPTELEGDELRRGLALGPPGLCQTDANQETVDDEEPVSDDTSQASSDSESSERTVCAPPRPGVTYDWNRGNAYTELDPNAKVLDTFTTLREANKTALSAARYYWRPQGARLGPNLMWMNEVLPYIEEKERHVDSEEVELKLPGLASATSRDLQSWGFTSSKIWVQKRNLHGPMNLAIDFTLSARDRKQATCASEQVDVAAKDVDQAVIEVEQEGETSAQAVAEDEEDSIMQNPEVVGDFYEQKPNRLSDDESEVSEED